MTGTLALALGALTATLAIVRGVLLRPLPYDAPHQLVVICERHPSLAHFCVGSPPDAADFAARSRSFAAIGVARDWGFTLDRNGERTPLRGGLASDGLFQVFPLRPAPGRAFEPADLGADRRVAILSHAFWVTAFGADPSVVGRSITLDDAPWTIVGVLGERDAVPTLREVQLWAPLPFAMTDPAQRGWRGFQVFARLRGGVTVSQARAEVRSVARALAAEYAETNRSYDADVRDARDPLVGETRPLLLAFLAATILVALVAAVNIANLMLARATARSREVAVQAAIGGGSERLIRGLALESFLLALAGAAGAFLVARLVLAGFLRLAPPGVPRLDGVGLGWDAALVALALGLLIATAAVLVPVSGCGAWTCPRRCEPRARAAAPHNGAAPSSWPPR